MDKYSTSLLSRVEKPRLPVARDKAPDPVDEASVESFPASDPPAFSPTRVGPPVRSPEN